MNQEESEKYKKIIEEFIKWNDNGIYEIIIIKILELKNYDLFDDEILQLREWLKEKMVIINHGF